MPPHPLRSQKLSEEIALSKSYQLAQLPYSSSAFLEPHISEESLNDHPGTLHPVYIKKLNEVVDSGKLADKSATQNFSPAKGNAFNDSGQAWNHTFYWQCLSRESVFELGSEFSQAIAGDFGSVDDFKNDFTDAATSLFGSFWIWLVLNQKGKLEIVGTDIEDTPVRYGQVPLLTCDVGEHAFFLGYKNARPDYLQAFWKLVNWQFVNQQYNATIPAALSNAVNR